MDSLRDKARLINKVSIDENGCWNWKGGLSGCGYGYITFEGKKQGAHRVSYKLFNGPIPKNMLVLHKCDNRACINPDHLFLGTHQDNMDDMWEKGRGPVRTFALNKEVFLFRHKESGEVFEGTGYDFRMKYGLCSGHVSRLTRGKLKSCKGWVINA